MEEGFNSKDKDAPANIYQPLSCPQGMSSYQAMGHTICCEGDTTGNKCDMDACYLASTGQIDPLENGTLPCGIHLFRLQKKNSELFCNTSMPHYYRDSKTGNSGCASEIVSDYSAPTPGAIDAKKVCKIYKNETETNEKIDSCKKMAEAYTLQTSQWCKQVDCMVSVVKNPGGRGPALVQSTYKNPASNAKTSTGTPVPVPSICYSKESGLQNVQYFYTGDMYDGITKSINAGTEPWVCGYVPPPNCMVKYLNVDAPKTAGSYLVISQIVVFDLQGNSIPLTNKVSQYTSPAERGTSASFAVDGNKSVHTIPNLYASEKGHFVLDFDPPVCISKIIYYGNNFRSELNAGIIITLQTIAPKTIWTSSPSTQQDIQTFTVDTKIYDPK